MNPFYEGQYLSFHTISDQARTAINSLGRSDWTDFLVLADVLEGSRATGRPPARVIEEVDSELFVLNGTVFGGAQSFICARRGRKVLVAYVVGRSRWVGKRELGAARDALEAWRRANSSRRPDARKS